MHNGILDSIYSHSHMIECVLESNQYMNKFSPQSVKLEIINLKLSLIMSPTRKEIKNDDPINKNLEYIL